MQIFQEKLVVRCIFEAKLLMILVTNQHLRQDLIRILPNHLNDNTAYKEVKLREKEMAKLVKKINKMCEKRLNKQNIFYSEHKYFCFNFTKSTTL